MKEGESILTCGLTPGVCVCMCVCFGVSSDQSICHTDASVNEVLITQTACTHLTPHRSVYTSPV